jgi:hypothetical protein
MKLLEFLKQFQGLDPDLEVCVADWNEGYRVPSGSQAKAVLTRGVHVPSGFTGHFDDPREVGELPKGQFIQIGGE